MTDSAQLGYSSYAEFEAERLAMVPDANSAIRILDDMLQQPDRLSRAQMHALRKARYALLRERSDGLPDT